jgi:uncharacterized membrane protein
MNSLIVVGYQGKHRAAEVLSQLEHLQHRPTFELIDALAVYRTNSGRLRIDHSTNPTKVLGGAFGSVIGALIGALVALPFTAGASLTVAASTIAASTTMLGAVGGGVGAEEARTFQNQHGIPEDFVKRVSALIQPGNSALFAEAYVVDPVDIAKHFQGYGGTLLSTTLEPETAGKVKDILGA